MWSKERNSGLLVHCYNDINLLMLGARPPIMWTANKPVDTVDVQSHEYEHSQEIQYSERKCT